jgi:hypothetical protein
MDIGLRHAELARPDRPASYAQHNETWTASLPHVFLESRFRLRLPSHPASRRRSCLRLVVGAINLHRGLAPPSCWSCWAHSGSRGGCPPRLPQNRACAVHTRLLGTAGYEPRRRPLSMTLTYPHSIASCGWVGATISSCQSRCSITSESSPRSVKNRVRRALSTCGIWLSAHRDLRPV